MRGHLLDALFDAMARDERLFFLTADMGINLVERFEAAYPRRFLNVGIAEQNLIGVAAGLVNTGFRPFVYTISNFLIHRAFEQIRNDVLLHNYPVVLLGTSAGWDNPPLGPTHHILDDWGALAALGGSIDIYCPSGKAYAASLVPRLIAANRPAYVRIAKASALDQTPCGDLIHEPGAAGGTILAGYGTTASLVLDVQRRSPGTGALIVQKLHPLDARELDPILARYANALVVEDHFAHSGLYASLCREAMAGRWPVRIESAAPSRHSLEVSPDEKGYFRRFGMDADAIAARLGASL
jgi:transketolase